MPRDFRHAFCAFAGSEHVGGSPRRGWGGRGRDDPHKVVGVEEVTARPANYGSSRQPSAAIGHPKQGGHQLPQGTAAAIGHPKQGGHQLPQGTAAAIGHPKQGGHQLPQGTATAIGHPKQGGHQLPQGTATAIGHPKQGGHQLPQGTAAAIGHPKQGGHQLPQGAATCVRISICKTFYLSSSHGLSSNPVVDQIP